MSWVLRAPWFGLLIAALVSSCGDPKLTVKEVDDGGPAAGGGAAGSAQDGPTAGGQGGFFIDARFADVPASSASADAASCATQAVIAERLPLELYLMLDSSLSMLETTSSRVTKWEAVRNALGRFLGDPQSAGIGIGLQYFPLVRAGVPDECTVDAACGASGPCSRIRTCSPSTRVQPCDRDADCARGQRCVLLGACAVSNEYCTPVGTRCSLIPLNNQCLEIPGYCQNRDVCEIAPYATPAVPIAALPGAAGALMQSLAAKQPDGLTPTGPALAGAIQLAQARARQMTDRRVAVVLATDGLPVECSPRDIPGISAIASMAAAANPAVSTFVIGVFAPEEAPVAGPNLDAMASAGGTGKAFVIDTNQDVTQAFAQALERIRTAALACEFKVPPPTMGRIDFNKVNVQHTAATGAVSTIGNVADKAACHPMRGGWYYDVKPEAGNTPSKIVACESTCNQLRAGGRVDIVLGCKTLIIE